LRATAADKAARLVEVRDVALPAALATIAAGAGGASGAQKADFVAAKQNKSKLEKELRILVGIDAFRTAFPAVDALVRQVAVGGSKVDNRTKADIRAAGEAAGLDRDQAGQFLEAVVAAAAETRVSWPRICVFVAASALGVACSWPRSTPDT
jgi:hypothetical protein